MSPIIVAIAAFIGVAALVGGVAMLLRGNSDSAVEDRLDQLANAGVGGMGREAREKSSVLASPLDEYEGWLERFVSRFGNLTLLLEQADTALTPPKFLAGSAAVGMGGAVAFSFTGMHPSLIPVVGVTCGLLPLMWLIMKRKLRMKKFAAQLPDALELIARALRAGHSLGAGFQLVAQEMTDPIGKEFNRVFEEQNLGIPMDEALRSMTERMPNLDLKFFVTAIVLQRQTGGDLAEILDKIGHLIRERFQIWGQVQALTGEGRLSGVVLLALPPVLFVAVYRMNPSYMMILFSDDLGKKMLVGGVISQLVGALVIRKIVNIKV
jgi:tight adherence protein B